MRTLLPWLLIPLLALAGCPAGDDDDATADDDDDDSTGEPTLGVPDAIPDGWIWEDYATLLASQGYVGSPPYHWSLAGGALPPGVTLASSGEISGVPGEQGSFAFDVRVEDSAGHAGDGPLTLHVGINPESQFLALAFDEWPEICLDLGLLCTPWVRIDGAGEPQSERALTPALFHVGLDGVPDAGRDDDVLLELLDPAEVTFGFTPIADPTGDGSTLLPDDTTVTPDGVLIAGEGAGRGRVELAHPDHPPGSHVVFIVAPDWCPGYGC